MRNRDVSKEKNPNYKTGYCIKGNTPSFYHSWQGMKARCFNKNNPKYKRYGGRGITICEDWLKIENFANWSLSNGWKEGMTIDRIDNDGNYCPENCRWVSLSENSRKKSTTKIDMITAQEIRSRINENWKELAKEYNCTEGNIWFIMNNFTHLPDENACATKIKEYKQSKMTR